MFYRLKPTFFAKRGEIIVHVVKLFTRSPLGSPGYPSRCENN